MKMLKISLCAALVGAASSLVAGYVGRDPRYPDFAERNFKLPMRVMFLGAHPDDPEYDFGFAAAKLVRAGARVVFVSVCNGNKGHQTMKSADLAARRYAETQASAKVFGIEKYIVLDTPDCELEPTLAMRQRLTRLVRQFAPHMLVTHRTCDYHADHRAVGQLVQDLTYFLGVPLFCPDTPVPETLPFVMYAGDPFTVPRPIRPDLVVDGTDDMDVVTRAIACHESQVFEWLPPEFGVDPKTIPTDPKERQAFVAKQAMLDLRSDGEQHRAVVSRLFGGDQVRCVNVLEICEYSRQPCAKEKAFLTAVPGFKWAK